jgi:hypothetical protein
VLDLGGHGASERKRVHHSAQAHANDIIAWRGRSTQRVVNRPGNSGDSADARARPAATIDVRMSRDRTRKGSSNFSGGKTDNLDMDDVLTSDQTGRLPKLPRKNPIRISFCGSETSRRG